MTTKSPVRLRVSRIFQLNPDSILGLIMFGVVLGMQEPSDSPMAKAIISFVGVFALWIGHVFAHTMAGNNVTQDHHVSLRTSLKQSLRTSWPMFVWTAPSLAVLLISPMFGASDAQSTDAGLYAMMISLFVIGGLIFAARRRSIPWRILAGLATSLVGVVIVVVEIAVRGLH